MNKVLIAICAAMLVMTGCSSTKGGSQTKAGVEQRDLFENKDDAAKTARTQQEQDELKRQMEEQKRKQEEAARRAAEAVAARRRVAGRLRVRRIIAAPAVASRTTRCSL